MLVVNRRIRVPLREFHFSFARSGGPGGQHVNTASTKAVLRWDVARSASLPEDVRARFLARFARRVNREGELVLASERFRDQGRNVADCLEKLRAMLAEVAARPKTRKATQPTRGAKERRLQEKRIRSEKKKGRGRVRPNDA